MGSTKTVTQTTQQAKTSPMEEKLLGLEYEQRQQTMQPQTQAQLSGLNLVNQLLTGTTPLPGFFGEMGAGISPEAIGTQATELTRGALPQFQDLGILESGTMAKNISQAIANQLLFPAEQFNIGAKQNLLNLALSGQAQVQQPIMAGQQTLASQLAGLRSITGTQTQTSNPFLQNFYTGLGQGAAAAPFAMMACWVAKEIFGSWEHPKTKAVRFYILNLAPKWFRWLYLTYGERFANFIHNKSMFKLMLRPLFEYFAYRGCREVKYA